MDDVMLFVAVHSPNVTLLFDHFQCHCTIVWRFFLEMWTLQLPEILKLCPRTVNSQYIIWMNEHSDIALFALRTLMCFPCITRRWRHYKVVRQRWSCATLHHSFITIVWWYKQQLVSDRLLSLFSKENTHNVR